MIWAERRLGDVTENFDAARIPVRAADRRPGPYPYYGASGVIDRIDSFLFDGEYLLVAEDGENLRTRKTPIAFVARGKFWVNNHAHVVRGNELAETRFLYYYLSVADISGYLSGSTQPKLTQASLARVPVRLPPPDEQRAIAGVLGALDDEIELNRRMNETLEQTTEILFTREFGDATEVALADEFDVTMGQSPPGDTYNELGEGAPFFQGRADFGFRFPSNRVYCTAPTRRALAGDTLVSVRAPVGDVNMAFADCAIGRGVAAVRHKSGSRSVTYYAMKRLRAAFDVFESEGTVFGSLSKIDFAKMRVPKLSESAARFEELVGPLDERIQLNERESRTLAELRDALLPKLISGELRVRHIA